jgi:3-oxoacyl-(acyl-carrier-protein) synthase
MKDRSDIVVTGLGAVCPLGLDTESFWSATLSGVVATNPLVRFDTTTLSSQQGGEVQGFQTLENRSHPVGASLTVDLAVAAGAMAVEDAALAAAGVEFDRVGVCFGTVMATRPAIESWMVRPPSSRRLHSPAAEQTWLSPSLVSRAPAGKLGFGGPNCVISTACAAGNSAISYAADALRAGRADAMVAGGADELSQAMLLMFDSFRALAPDVVRPFDLHRRGLLLAEGAAALVLERESDARARRAHLHGRVLGYANLADAHHITAPHPEGDGAIRSMLSALARADVAPTDLDYISAHGTGTPSNDAVEARAIRHVLGDCADHVPVSALKGSLGHAQGAASAIEAVSCLLAIRDGLIPPTANHRTCDPACDIDVVADRSRKATLKLVLNNAFGFGGNIECVVFGAP